MSRHYPILEDGESVEPKMEGFKLQCCDCGLVHKIDFEVIKGAVHFKAWRDKRSTAQVRRHIRRKAKEVKLMIGKRCKVGKSKDKYDNWMVTFHPGGGLEPEWVGVFPTRGLARYFANNLNKDDVAAFEKKKQNKPRRKK